MSVKYGGAPSAEHMTTKGCVAWYEKETGVTHMQLTDSIPFPQFLACDHEMQYKKSLLELWLIRKPEDTPVTCLECLGEAE